MSQQQIPANEPREIDFAAPTTVGDEVLGTDSQTLQGFITLASPNAILRMIIEPATPNTKFDIIIKRDGKEVRRFPSDLLLSTLPGPYFAGFPLPIRPGAIQFYAEQKSGSTGVAAKLYVIWNHSLVQVVS